MFFLLFLVLWGLTGIGTLLFVFYCTPFFVYENLKGSDLMAHALLGPISLLILMWAITMGLFDILADYLNRKKMK